MTSFTAFVSDIFQYLPVMLCGLGSGCQGGLGLNILLALIAIPISVVAGTTLGAIRALGISPFGQIIAAYTELVKAVPLILVIFWLDYSLPVFLGIKPPIVMTAVAALVLFGAANVSEVVRSGLDSVGAPEIENAGLQGLTRWQIARLIVIPQVFTNILPALLGVTVTLFKDTSLVFVLGLMELTHTGMLVSNRYPDKLVAMYALIGAGYMLTSLSLVKVAGVLQQRRLRRLGRDDVPPSA
jgi:His/Glu/Gln/Arg/opine family amino acid ABC transporter permease subunit